MIDREKLEKYFDGLKYTVKRSWIEDEHEVMLIDFRNKKQAELGGPLLFCECDFDYYLLEKDGRTYVSRRSNPNKCSVKKVVRQRVVKEWQERYGDYWKDIGTKEAVMDIFRKAEVKDYLGQCEAGMIYLQEVAKLLGVEPFYSLSKEVGQLYGEERLDLNGYILTDFEQRFRFPSEIRDVLRFIFSDYADTSDFLLAEIESALTDFYYKEENGEKTYPFPSGKDIFPEDWPNIKPDTLAYFGRLWLEYAKARGQKTLLDDVENAQAGMKEAYDALDAGLDYIHELEEDSQRYSEKIRQLSAEKEKLIEENEALKKQLEEKEHKCEGKCAQEFVSLLQASVIKIMKKYGVRVFIGGTRNCSGKFSLIKFGVDLESRALKNLLFQLFNVENQVDFNFQMDCVGLMDALQKAEDGEKRMGFFLDLNEIMDLNGGKVVHCGKCKGK
ncbi:MAG: hypothetical protein COU51_04500 [Parcubacteria group bacterium CG10_big_fil_rev_8_21_14_0_10_36_14]|nr:MAG: hypothetical protein COU51_04500 [Parcubacteria group bacterium CG10_big_fil_rev_8_21_14_0_10_36_14]